VADICSLEDCDDPAAYHARIEWRETLGDGTWDLTVPLGFCKEHTRSLRQAAPTGAVWLEYFDGD
jgi:hypothetical protein